MRKKVLKRIALLVAPIIWRKIRGRRGHRRGHRHGYRYWHSAHKRGYKRRRIWL